jgi:hypothetical protein
MVTNSNFKVMKLLETDGVAPANINLSLNLPGGGSIQLYDGNTGASGNGAVLMWKCEQQVKALLRFLE